MRLGGPGDTAGRVFGAAALGIIEGFGVIVEVFFGPGWFELPFAGPLDAVPAVSVIGRGFGHEEVLAYQEPNRAANQQVEGHPGKQKAEWNTGMWSSARRG